MQFNYVGREVVGVGVPIRLDMMQIGCAATLSGGVRDGVGCGGIERVQQNKLDLS